MFKETFKSTFAAAMGVGVGYAVVGVIAYAGCRAFQAISDKLESRKTNIAATEE